VEEMARELLATRELSAQNKNIFTVISGWWQSAAARGEALRRKASLKSKDKKVKNRGRDCRALAGLVD
jgi:hypothetical protein